MAIKKFSFRFKKSNLTSNTHAYKESPNLNANLPRTHLRFGVRERLQKDPGEEPAHHLLRPSCARPDPPKRTQNQNTITSPTHSESKQQRTEHTATKPCRRGIWTGGGRRGGWTEQTEPAREERGTARRSGFPSLHATSLSWPRLKIPVMRRNGMRRRWRSGGEASTSAVSSNQPDGLPSSLVQNHGRARQHFFYQL